MEAAKQKTKEYSEETKKAGEGSQRFKSALGDIAGSVGVPLTLGAITLAAVGVGKAVVDMGMRMEQTKIAFTTLIGSAEGAQAHLEDLRDFAATTPFEFNDLTEASRKLQAFGFEARDVVPMLTDIGDAVAAMGGNAAMIDRVTLAIGQMSAKGRVQAGEMLQLTEAGIPAWRYLAEAMGMTTAEVMKMSEKGLIPADEAIQSILAGMRQDFGGMMAEQSKTAAGAVSNLNDALARLATVIGEQANPAIRDFSMAAAGVVNSTAEMLEGQTAVQDAIAKGVITQEQYNEIVREAGHPAKALAEAMRLVRDAEAEQRREQERVTVAVETTTAAIVDGTGAGERFAEATLRIPAALEAAEEQLKRNADMVKGLSFLMSGAVGNELRSYADAQTEIRDKMAEVTAKIAELNAKEHLTADQRQQLADYKQQYADLNTALDENAAAHEEAMKRIMFSILQGQMAVDGFTTQEVMALTTIAEKWGLVDSATKTTTDAIAQAVGEAQATGNWNLLYARLDTFKDKLLTTPTNLNVDINVVTRYSSQGAPPSAAAGELNLPGGSSAPVVYNNPDPDGGNAAPGGAYAVGGPVQPNRVVAVHRDEQIVLPRGGTVLNKAEAKEAMGGLTLSIGAVTIYAGAGAGGRQIADDFLAQVAARARALQQSGAFVLGSN